MKQKSILLNKDGKTFQLTLFKGPTREYYRKLIKLPFEERKNMPEEKAYIVSTNGQIGTIYYELPDKLIGHIKYDEIKNYYLQDGWKNVTPDFETKEN